MEEKNKIIMENLQSRFPKGLIEELLIIPEELQEKENRLLALNFKLSEIKRSFDFWESQELRRITEEVDEKGKKIFSNAELRKGELDRRAKQNVEMKSLYEDESKTKVSIETLTIEINYLKRRLSSLKIVANVIIGGK